MNSEVLTEREVSQDYRLSVPWLRKARRERRGPRFLRIVRMIRYRRRDVEIFLAQHAVEPGEIRIEKGGVAAKDAP